MLLVWWALLMVFTSAAGMPLMLGGLLLAVCGLASLAALARGGMSRGAGAFAFRQRFDGASSTARSFPVHGRWGA